MSNETITISDFDFNFICEYFSGLERQGPGSPEVTLKALSFIDQLPSDACIADLGCGTGGQTMILAQHVSGQITGLDLFPKFIDIFNRNSEKLGLSGHVKGRIGSMDNLPFEEESLDLIWSEGAIYNIGFERGMREWRKYIKPDGFIAVTECCWLSNARPKDYKYLTDNFFELDSIANKLQVMSDAGYKPVAHFILPEQCWTENYFAPMPTRMQEFMEENKYSMTVKKFIDSMKEDMSYYQENKAYYGYVFFIGQKVAELEIKKVVEPKEL